VKFIPGCLVTKAITGRDWRYCITFGFLMNTRGLVELIALNVGLSSGVLGTKLFTILILMAIITTLMTGPLLYFCYQRDFDAEAERTAEESHGEVLRNASFRGERYLESIDSIGDATAGDESAPTGGERSAGITPETDASGTGGVPLGSLTAATVTPGITTPPPATADGEQPRRPASSTFASVTVASDEVNPTPF